MDCISTGLRCQEVVYRCYTPGTLKNQTVYSIRARRTKPDISVSNLCDILQGALSRLSLWSDHSVSVLVEDAPVPMWLQYIC